MPSLAVSQRLHITHGRGIDIQIAKFPNTLCVSKDEMWLGIFNDFVQFMRRVAHVERHYRAPCPHDSQDQDAIRQGISRAYADSVTGLQTPANELGCNAFRPVPIFEIGCAVFAKIEGDRVGHDPRPPVDRIIDCLHAVLPNRAESFSTPCSFLSGLVTLTLVKSYPAAVSGRISTQSFRIVGFPEVRNM